MHLLALLIALAVSFQPQPKAAEQDTRLEQTLKGFDLYKDLASVDAALADDQLSEGSALLFYRAAHFVHVYGKATPAEAVKAAAAVVQISDVRNLGLRLNVGPLEVEKRADANAAADEEWVTKRNAALMLRKDLAPVFPLIKDLKLPLPGRARYDILSEKDREEQFKARWTVLATALRTLRKNTGVQTELSDEDSKAASTAAREQLDRDYMQVNGCFVRVRGRAAACAHTDVDAVTEVLLDWVGPALMELEGAKHLTLVPVESGWVVVDADTGWSLRDPTIGKFSERDVAMIEKGLHAAHLAPAPSHGPHEPGGSKPSPDK